MFFLQQNDSKQLEKDLEDSIIENNKLKQTIRNLELKLNEKKENKIIINNMSASIKSPKNIVPPMKFGEVLQFSVEDTKKATIRASEIFEKHTEPDQSKRLKSVADRTKKVRSIRIAKIEAAKKNK